MQLQALFALLRLDKAATLSKIWCAGLAENGLNVRRAQQQTRNLSVGPCLESLWTFAKLRLLLSRA